MNVSSSVLFQLDSISKSSFFSLLTDDSQTDFTKIENRATTICKYALHLFGIGTCGILSATALITAIFNVYIGITNPGEWFNIFKLKYSLRLCNVRYI